MPHPTMEYIIMTPILILQVLLFPLAAGWMMSIWTDSRREIVLQETADHLGSLIQQVYFSLNRESVHSGRVIQFPDVPKFIENYAYTARGSLRSSGGGDSSKILELNLTLNRIGVSEETSVVLGPNVVWDENSVYRSNSTNACIIGQKFLNGTIKFSFG